MISGAPKLAIGKHPEMISQLGIGPAPIRKFRSPQHHDLRRNYRFCGSRKGIPELESEHVSRKIECGDLPPAVEKYLRISYRARHDFVKARCRVLIGVNHRIATIRS